MNGDERRAAKWKTDRVCLVIVQMLLSGCEWQSNGNADENREGEGTVEREDRWISSAKRCGLASRSQTTTCKRGDACSILSVSLQGMYKCPGRVIPSDSRYPHQQRKRPRGP
ncbi:uncharacterized protein UTRI_04087 [Ustilago trichophora]|uniref:Uncharacterized protein n=1 Tax=Ustilago trichophora TaxID=86804 RepID=A0A5C3E7R8_9BASI|nr:uncharacterized protein UTRI_04087 [Ustilago trichophora]